MGSWIRRIFARKPDPKQSAELMLLPESKLEALAAMYLGQLPADKIDARIHESFRLARLWLTEVRAGEKGAS